MVVIRDSREEEMGSWCLMGTEFQLGMMKRFWKWIVVMGHKLINIVHATAVKASRGLRQMGVSPPNPEMSCVAVSSAGVDHELCPKHPRPVPRLPRPHTLCGVHTISSVLEKHPPSPNGLPAPTIMSDVS